MHDEKLILYYYEDGLSDLERRQVAVALENDAALAARYAELRRELVQLAAVGEQAVPAHAVQRWHDSIDRAARLEAGKASRPGTTFSIASFVLGAAVTAALAIGIGIGAYFSANQSTAPLMDVQVAGNPAYPQASVPSAFARGLQVYLRDSRRDLSGLPLYPAEDRAVLVRGILEQNRLLERAADTRNSPALARVLRAFEPIVVRLADEDLTPQELEALRAQLAFELNVMLTKLEIEASVEPDTI